jgi:dTDP-4-amino-4,6-dideoxygalactose transaminase
MNATRTTVPFVDMSVVNEPYTDELRAAFERVLRTCQFVGGNEVLAFEQQLADYVDSPHALGLNSGTAALQLALLAADVGPGDEVLLPANTFFATAEAVMAVGATPVLVDCSTDTALMDADATEAAITERTAAIIVVHLYGQPVDADRFREMAERHGLFLLEDNAQAIGARWQGRMTGSLGDAAAFSFYPGKNLGALGEGGAVTTTDSALAHRIDLLRSHGSTVKYHHEEWGWNERLHGMQAAFLSVKLAHLEHAQKLRNDAVEQYRQLIGHDERIQWFTTALGATHVWHLLVVQVANRDAVLEKMSTRGIGVGIHYPMPVHLTPAAEGRLGTPGQFPNAERLSRSIISLPLFSGITVQQVELASRVLQETVEATS